MKLGAVTLDCWDCPESLNVFWRLSKSAQEVTLMSELDLFGFFGPMMLAKLLKLPVLCLAANMPLAVGDL